MFHSADKIERGPFSLARFCMLRKNYYGSVRCAKWYNLAPYNFVELFWSVRVD